MVIGFFVLCSFVIVAGTSFLFCFVLTNRSMNGCFKVGVNRLIELRARTSSSTFFDSLFVDDARRHFLLFSPGVLDHLPYLRNCNPVSNARLYSLSKRIYTTIERGAKDEKMMALRWLEPPPASSPSRSNFWRIRPLDHPGGVKIALLIPDIQSPNISGLKGTSTLSQKDLTFWTLNRLYQSDWYCGGDWSFAG